MPDTIDTAPLHDRTDRLDRELIAEGLSAEARLAIAGALFCGTLTEIAGAARRDALIALHLQLLAQTRVELGGA